MQPPRQLHKRSLDGRFEVWERMHVRQPSVWVEATSAEPAHWSDVVLSEWVLIGVFIDPREAFALFRSSARAPRDAGDGFGSGSESVACRAALSA